MHSAAYILNLLLAGVLGRNLPGGPSGRADDWGSWRGDQLLGVLAAHACCLVLGLGMVSYVARTDEMALREHFKCQHLGAHLFQEVRRRGQAKAHKQQAPTRVCKRKPACACVRVPCQG